MCQIFEVRDGGLQNLILARVLSGHVIGIDAHRIEVEVDIASRGLPDAAVKESRDRIKADLKNIGFNLSIR